MGSELTRGQAGFTLIEVAVVVAILSVLAIGSVLSLPSGGGVSDRAALMRAHGDLRSKAVLGARPLALFLGPGGQQREIWQPGEDRAPWVASGAPVPWQRAPRIDTPDRTRRIVFLPNGRATPLQLRLGGAGAPGYDCVSRAWGPLECKPL